MATEYIELISRQAAIEKTEMLYRDARDNANYMLIGYNHALSDMRAILKSLPSAQPEGWMERNKDRILQAGKEGREVELRIGGRLFAIREKAQ